MSYVSAASAAGVPHDVEVSPAVLRKVLGASFIGNFVEWFDYASYGFFATVIAKAFFPEIAPESALLATFAVCVSACNFDPLRRGIGVQF